MTGGRPAVSVVVVHYRTPQLLAPSLRAIGEQLAELSLQHELLVVDNSGDAGDPELERVRVLRPDRNLGYAGGVWHGVEATRGELVIAMNPDVVVLPGCLSALLAVARPGAVAGPRFFWDSARRLLLPPGEHRVLSSELVRALAQRSRRFAAPARRQWRRHARAHWEARQPLDSAALSGALLVFSRSVWEHVGPFDAGYPLYFEETDWLLRARRRGVRTWHVPEAAAVHHFDQSGRDEPEREHWYGLSCRRFRERHYGRLTARLLERLEAHTARPEALPPWPPSSRSGPFWVEVSPRAQGFPAAAERGVEVPEAWVLPDEVPRHHPDLALTATLVDSEGREGGRYRLR